MAAIREELFLADKFSGTLEKYLTQMGSADDITKALGKKQNKLAQQIVLTNAKLNATNASLDELKGHGGEGSAAFNKLEADSAKLADQLANLQSQFVITSDYLETMSNLPSDTFSEAGEAAEQFSGDVEEAGETAEEAGERTTSAFGRAAKAAGKFALSLPIKALKGVGNQLQRLNKFNPFNLLRSQGLRFAASLLSVRKILSYLIDTMKVAPQEIQTSWSGLKNTLSSFVNSGFMGILNGLKSGMDRLNAAFNSPAGQKFAAGMYTVGQMIGQVISLVFNAIAGLVEFVGNNFQTIMTIASIALAVFAGYMLFSAMATLLANLPLLLLIGILAALVIGLNECGVTAGDIFEVIGEGAAWLYALGYNLIADIWNLIADFASFFANVFNDPVGAIGHLFVDLADFVLGILETLAGAIDSLFGSNLAGVVSGWRSNIQQWADDTFGVQNDVVQKMKKISPEDTKGMMKDWGGKFRNFGESLSDFNLTQTAGGLNIPSSVNGIGSSVGGSLGSDVSSIKKEVAMSEEELAALVDLAQRQYVNQINLTAQSPIINIKGQNTGDSAEDRKALADTLRDILIEQSSAGTYRSTARVY